MNQVEKKIVLIGGTAPRVTPQMIDALIDSLSYDTHFVPGTTTVVVTSMLPSGFTVATAHAACASPENFNPALGIELAISKCREESRRKLWEFEGYRLKASLHEASKAVAEENLVAIRSVLAPGDERSLGETLNEHIADLAPSVQQDVNEHAKRAREMLATYSNAECLGLIVALLESPRLGISGHAANEMKACP